MCVHVRAGRGFVPPFAGRGPAVTTWRCPVVVGAPGPPLSQGSQRFNYHGFQAALCFFQRLPSRSVASTFCKAKYAVKRCVVKLSRHDAFRDVFFGGVFVTPGKM